MTLQEIMNRIDAMESLLDVMPDEWYEVGEAELTALYLQGLDTGMEVDYMKSSDRS